MDNLKTSGLVGLGPPNKFIPGLKSQGAMDQAIFSLSIAPLSGKSKITFGGYNLEEYATGKIEWHKRELYDSHHWGLTMESFDFLPVKGSAKEWRMSVLFNEKNKE